MVALASLPYPFATFVSYKAHKTFGKTLIRSSIRVPTSSLRRVKRKNYLRPKILRTLTKPYNIPLDDQIAGPIQPIEPNVEAPLDSTGEQSGSRFVKESENESDMSQLEVVRDSRARNMMDFGGISGSTIVKIVGSFVGLFILQTLVAVWVMDSGKSDENNGSLVVGDRKKDLRLRMREGEMGINGNALLKDWAGVGVDESEMEAKISEIRKMAWEVREAEKKKKVENGEADLDDASDDDDDNEGFEGNDSKINSGIVKEVDVRLNKLKKKYPAPSLNVNLLNQSGGSGKEEKKVVLDGIDEDSMLMYKRKHKFRSHLTKPEEKPKGFQYIDGVREKHSTRDDEKPVEGTGSGNDMSRIIDVLEETIPEKRNNDTNKEGKIPVPQSSSQLKTSGKGFGSNGARKKLDKEVNGSTAKGSYGSEKKASKGMNGSAKQEDGSSSLESNGTTKKLSKEVNEGAKPQKGLVQDSSDGNILDLGSGAKMSSTIATEDKKKLNDRAASTSESPTIPRRKGQPNFNQLGRKLSQSNDKDELENVDPWWSKLPYVIVILMQNGIGSEAQRGFYTISTDAEDQSYSSYTVAFEDRNDAMNFSYLLESAFEDLPDAAVDIAPISAREFKEITETLEDKVFVLRKGELKLYAGQPLAEAEAALRSLMK